MTQGLGASLAQLVAADWRGRFDGGERAALTAAVRTAFVDTAACILAGRAEPASAVVLAWARAQGGGPATSSLAFGGERLAAAPAALANAAMGHALDFDDVALAGHPSVVLMPALWAEHERGGASGFALVQAYAKGYAVWAELQRRQKASLHARGWHPTAVFGTVAAAAAVASLRGLSAAQCQHAIGIAASMASGVIANFGSMTKPLQAARAAANGIAAVELAQAGLTASPDALEGRAGLLAALAGPSGADLDGPCADDAANALLRIRPGIKKYPVCYAAHRVIDGVLDLAQAHGVAAADVARVDASLSETTAGVLRHHDPRSVDEARFSLEFVVAQALSRRAVGVAELSPAALGDADLRALMARVHTHTLTTSCPLEPSFAWADRVVLTLRDGRVLDSGDIRFARGHAELPLDDAQLRAKLLACAAPHENDFALGIVGRIDRALGEPADA